MFVVQEYANRRAEGKVKRTPTLQQNTLNVN